ncbi:MAG TPA: ATP synthase F1 subunit gamma [Amoebophilaceae bacterium]|nr:ATP synthase F1 subunit gamma [Amoebophilaceae bacterium]
MPNIKEVVNQINSVTSTQQITKAMKMVAAARLNKVQQQVLQMRLYAEKLIAMLKNVTASTDQQLAQRYLEERPAKNLLLVVMTSDRGLCGSFNTKVLRKTLNYIQPLAYGLAPEQITILPIGRKAFSFFEKRTWRLIPDYVALSHHLAFDHASPVADFLTDSFLRHTYDQIVLVYNAFQSAATQVPIVEQFLPIIRPATDTANQEAQNDYIYEPSKAALMEALVPSVLQIQFYKAQLESNASEHGARMTTMSKATDNAEELLKTLKLTYNRTRQAAITREISEIVAGAGALAV